MWTKIKIKTVCLSLACILSLLIIQRTQGTGYCDLPFITFVYRELNQPQEIVNKVVSQLGGLPKTDMDIVQALKQKDADVALAVYPVETWQIDNQRVTYDPSVKALLDDDPVYHHEFAIRVTYLDGDTATLQWSSWSYGVVACPVVVSLGIGPSGQFKIMPSSLRFTYNHPSS